MPAGPQAARGVAERVLRGSELFGQADESEISATLDALFERGEIREGDFEIHVMAPCAINTKIPTPAV